MSPGTENKLISVLMPAYNCENFVRQAIDSVLSQTYTHFELLIADDCSTDNTKKIIDSYTDKRIRRFHNETNLGYLLASNKLFAQCTGAYITFQDADDYASPERFEKLVNFLETHKDIDCVGSNITKVSSEGETFYTTNYPLDHQDILKEFLKYRVVMTGSALMLKKEVIEQTGIYHPYFNRIGSEDTYLFSLILDRFKVANMEDQLYYYRANPNSVGFTHKNPKALIGHELIVRMHKRRAEGKTDLLAQETFSGADRYAAFLLTMRAIESSRLKASVEFVWRSLLHPATGLSFAKEFAVKFLHKQKPVAAS